MNRGASLTVLSLAGALTLSACTTGTDSPDTTPAPATTVTVTESAPGQAEGAPEAMAGEFPDVVRAKVVPAGEHQFRVVVTMSSPYDTPQRYADGWRVLTPGGDVLVEHQIHHDHQHEQPFTRSRGPFPIPDGVTEVVIEGRDSEHGYGGGTVTVPVPRHHQEHRR